MSIERAQPADEQEDEKDDAAQWPLSFCLQASHPSGAKRWWSHDLYRGPSNKRVDVLYSNNKERSEYLAQMFLGEAIIGFDMEWPWDSEKRHRLQEKIGLIQVASEDKIALFHIGLHPGKTTEDIIAPSLRKLIESPTIAKAGVAIVNADFARLRKYFGLNPQAGFELSHLHRLVKFAHKPELLTTKLTKMAYQVEEHLGLPLSKGKVRTSNWSRALSQEQINYAAGDAYAGFMLFHCMNAKRTAMDPLPPLPLLADKYPSRTSGMPPITTLRLHPLVNGGKPIMADEFFSKVEDDEVSDEKSVTDPVEDVTIVSKGASKPKTDIPKTKTSKTSEEPVEDVTIVSEDASKPKTDIPKTKTSKTSEEPLDPISQSLFLQLSARRKALTQGQNLPAYCNASNAVLERLARLRPLCDNDILQIKGIGPKQQEKYGSEWLEVIAQFMATNAPKALQVSDDTTIAALDVPPAGQPSTPIRQPTRRRAPAQDSNDSSPALGTPTQRTPQLHTGLSFALSETKLQSCCVNAESPVGSFRSSLHATSQEKNKDPSIEMSDEDSDASSAFVTPPSGNGSQLKRKRSAGPLEGIIPKSPSKQPEALSPRSKIFRNQLVAFSRLVSNRLKTQSLSSVPIVSESTLASIVAKTPRTLQELHQVPGIEGFIQACKDTETDLLRNIIKFAPAKF